MSNLTPITRMRLWALLVFLSTSSTLFAADAGAGPAAESPTTATSKAAPAAQVITPGKVVIPFDRMRRIWGELVSLDLTTRTGTFRRESDDSIMSFTVLPYAQLVHHATNGDLQDFRVGERAIFRLHENMAGEWVWLSYIQDEMNFLFNHKEYYHVDAIDAGGQSIRCTDANADKTYIRAEGLIIETDEHTHYWKEGRAATFSDIRTGDKLRTRTHGVGRGATRVAWDIFLDDDSLLAFQAEQRAVHVRRMQTEGLPGYIDRCEERTLQMMLFREGFEQGKQLKPGQAVRVAPAGTDRRPNAVPVTGVVKSTSAPRQALPVTIELPADAGDFRPGGVVRLWSEPG